MKNIKDFLFTRNDKLNTSPFMIILLCVVVLSAIVYFTFFYDKESDDNNLHNETVFEDTEKGNFLNKIIKFNPLNSLFKRDKQNETKEDNSLPKVVDIPDNIFDEEDLSKGNQESEMDSFKTKMDEADISLVGRKDPMKKIMGTGNNEIGSFKGGTSVDLIDDSIDYFEGVSVGDIILDNIVYNTEGDDKYKAHFIVDSSIVPNLEEGDYLLDVYYIEKINPVKKQVILKYKDKSFILGPQNIWDKTEYEIGENGVPKNK